MRERMKKKKNIIIGGLLAVVFLMSVGYAAFASSLSITGTANTSSWIIKITNIQEKTKTSGVTNRGTSYTDLTANFNCELTLPGDSITYEVTVKNQGNIDASLKEVTKSFTNNKYIDVTYSGLYEGQMLYKQGAENSTAVMEVTVTFKDLDYEGPFTDTITSNISLDFNFEQEGNNVDTTKKYLVTYDSQGGTPVESRYVEWEEYNLASSATPINIGYTLSGWYTSPNGVGTKATPAGKTSSFISDETADGVTLYAHWTPKKYKYIYNSQGGNSISSTTYAWNTYNVARTSPKLKGYTFDGWYTELNGKGLKASAQVQCGDVVQAIYGKYNDVAGGEKGNEVTLYANWIPKEFVVQFDSQDGSLIPTQTYKWDELVTIPIPEKEGYMFNGWYTKLGSTGKPTSTAKQLTNNGSLSQILTNDSNINPITLYAYWTANS